MTFLKKVSSLFLFFAVLPLGSATWASPPTSSTENVALSARFTWDTGTPFQGSVSLFYEITGGEQKIGQWTTSSTGNVAATLPLVIWGVYRFELRDAAGNLLRTGAVVAFPTLQSGSAQVVIARATEQVRSAQFSVAMGDLITTQ